jgi:SAM-dependent methyltransferase
MTDSTRLHFPTDYDDYAPTYAWSRRALSWVLHPLTRLAGDLPADAALLEIGCGTANYIRALAELRLDTRCVGFDLSSAMLREARAFGSRVEFVRGDASVAFPFADRTYHLAFAVDAIHHIGDIPRFFDEVWRVLIPGGRLALVTDSEDTLTRRSLTTFFPEILAIELARYPRVPLLHEAAGRSGLRLVREDSATGQIPLDEDFVEALSAKCSSGMRLISAAEHAAGMARVRKAKELGQAWASYYDVLVYTRAPGAAAC